MNPLGSQIHIFNNIISMIGSERLMAGTQYQVMVSLASILSSLPEGAQTACLIRESLAAAVSKGSEDALKSRNRMQSLLEGVADVREISRLAPPAPIEKIDRVPSAVVTALKSSEEALRKAMVNPSQDVREAFAKLQRIIQMSGGVSQEMLAVKMRHVSPAVRYLERISLPTNGSRPPELGRTAPVFFRDGGLVHFQQWDELSAMLTPYFGSGLTREALSELFTLSQKDYRVAAVDMRTDPRGYLRINGEIRQGQERVGYFGMSIPPAPSLEGAPWSAKVEAISIIHKRVGIGGQLLVKLALFLQQKGVATMRADAMEDAGLFCVFNGFRVDRDVYENLVAEFVDDRRKQGKDLTDEQIQSELLFSEANLGDLAAFKADDRPVGREFLQGLFRRKYLPVSFHLDAEDQSWLQLLSNLNRDQPAPLAPLEWEALEPATRAMLYSGVHFVGGNVPGFMSTDVAHAEHLLERLNNWGSSVTMFYNYTPAMRERMPSLQQDMREKVAFAQDVLDMIATDPSSVLFRTFRGLLDPGSEEGRRLGRTDNHGVVTASAFLAHEKMGLLRVPPALKTLFEDLVSRE